MSTAEAITALRQKMSLTQRELADTIDVTIASISRYENGKRPSRDVLKKLAKVADDAALPDLRDIFLATWKADLLTRLRKTPSAGTQRVSLDDLKRWHEMPKFVQQQVLEARKIYMEVTSKLLAKMLKAHLEVEASEGTKLAAANRLMGAIANNLIPQISNSIEPYINIPKKEKTQ